MTIRSSGGSGPHHISTVIPSVLADLKPAESPPAESRPAESRADRYIRATRFVLANLVPVYRAAGLTITDVGVATIVGQLLSRRPNPPRQ